MNLIRGAWSGLDSKGRTALVVTIGVVLVAAIVFGVDLSGYLGLGE